MSVVCDLAARASQGLRGGTALSRLISVLSVLSGADAAVQIGSGGQVGLGDLPGLFTQRGIECYSPELGDSIWVTPLQWYANGMSCDGLRDPDREAIQKHIEEHQKKISTRFEESSQTFPDFVKPPPEFSGKIPDFKDSFQGKSQTSQAIKFTKPGKLKVDSATTNTTSGWGTFVTPNVYLGSFNFYDRRYWEEKIKPGDRVLKQSTINENGIHFTGFTADGITVPSLSVFSMSLITFFLAADGKRLGISSEFFGYRQSLDRPWFWGNFQTITNMGFLKADTKYQFIPDESRPRAGYKTIKNRRQIDTEEICKMGCKCGDIAKLINQQKQTDESLRKLIQEIHRAVAAGFFNSAAARSFAPEQRIESAGKTLYGSSPGRGGKINVTNLIDSTAALVAAEYHRLGLQKFPATVPKELIPNPNAAIEALDQDFISLQSLADFLEWQVKIDDERLGEWPIKFEFTDDGKKKSVSLINISEALADIYGALIKVVEDSDIGVQWGVRSAVEASKAGNASVKALHLLKEFVKFSGVLTQDNIKTIDSTFTPDPLVAQSAEDMLKPSKQDLMVTDIVDKRSLLGLILNISYWVQIAGRSVYGDLTNNPATRQPNMPGDSIRQMKRRSRVLDKRWDEWRRKRQQRRNIPLGDQPTGGEYPPDIKDISPQR